MNWVSVKERLPTEEKEYYVGFGTNGVLFSCGKSHFKNGKFAYNEQQDGCGELTHWKSIDVLN